MRTATGRSTESVALNIVFYVSAFVAILATAMVITRTNAVHALLYLITSLLAVAVIFYVLGAPFVAALEIIIYAGAIMVLFVFVVMMLSVATSPPQERQWLQPRRWIGPAALGAILTAELVYIITNYESHVDSVGAISPKQLGIALFGPYLLGVELASFLLLAGLVGAFHVARSGPAQRKKEEKHNDDCAG